MNIDEIKELIEILTTTDIAEFTVESEGVKISIKKGSAFVQAHPAQPPLPMAQHGEPGTGDASVMDASESEQDAANQTAVSAPMVGTFYRAPSPDSEPYVNVGDSVDVGQPLCIIEAMKLMNEIESEVAGRIVKILAENGQPVEYGQPLFIIEE